MQSSISNLDSSEDIIINGEYRILEKLGEGSYGSVYKAVSNKTGEIVALKRVEPSGEVESLLREIQILKNCHSEYVVKYFGSHYQDSVLWLIMEYCAAGSVIDLIRITKKALSESEIAVILFYALKGIEYLHENKKIHRDIKAGNILLDSYGCAKLADFGVSAELLHTWADKDTFIGSPFWMSPEVISKSKYNKKTDIWSLGITAIELAEGEPPYSHIHPMRAMFAIKQHPPQELTMPKLWSNEFNDFVRKCLNIDPKSRPSAKELLSHPFVNLQIKNKAVLSDLVAASLDAIEKARCDKKNGKGTFVDDGTNLSGTMIKHDDKFDTAVNVDNYFKPWKPENGIDIYQKNYNYEGTMIEKIPMEKEEESFARFGGDGGTFFAKEDEKGGNLPEFVLNHVFNNGKNDEKNDKFEKIEKKEFEKIEKKEFEKIEKKKEKSIDINIPGIPRELLEMDVSMLINKKEKLQKELDVELQVIKERFTKMISDCDKAISLKLEKKEPQKKIDQFPLPVKNDFYSQKNDPNLIEKRINEEIKASQQQISYSKPVLPNLFGFGLEMNGQKNEDKRLYKPNNIPERKEILNNESGRIRLNAALSSNNLSDKNRNFGLPKQNELIQNKQSNFDYLNKNNDFLSKLSSYNQEGKSPLPFYIGGDPGKERAQLKINNPHNNLAQGYYQKNMLDNKDITPKAKQGGLFIKK